MKINPACQRPDCPKEFADNLNFCQVCGASLIDAPAAEEPLDPFKTMVGKPADFAAAIPKSEPPPTPAVPEQKAEDVLDLPAADDSRKTQVVSEAEMRAELANLNVGQETVVDIPPPPAAEPPPPAFIEPEKPAAPEPPGHDLVGDPFMHTTPPIPSPMGQPLDMPKPDAEIKPEPTPEPAMPSFGSPFADPAASANPFETPFLPLHLKSRHQSQPLDNRRPQCKINSLDRPRWANMGGVVGGQQSKTLAIVSLVVGILGITVCCGGILPNLIAIVLGFMARGKANNDPINYGGAGLAMGGIITGVLGLLVGIGLWIFAIFFNGMALMMQGVN